MLEGMRFLAEAFFAAGAREVLLPIIGLEPIKDMDQLRHLDLPSMPGSRIECLSFHPLGSCRMGEPMTALWSMSRDSALMCKVYGSQTGSVFPSSVGVNTQIPVMTMAARTAAAILEH